MYQSYFRLREPAFNLTPDPRFFFRHSSHEEAYATLCYGVEQRKGIIVITGEAGTGKTTLLRMFVQNAAPKIHSSYILDPHLSFVELLRCMLDAFGLPESRADRADMIRQLNGYLIEQLEKGDKVALLLDEAQDLSNEVLEELRLLSNLEDAGEKLVQIVLIGNPEFESRLEQVSFCQLRQRIALRSQLAPLNSEDVCPYIECRLSTAGYTGDSLFATSAISRIALYSKGIPRLINTICDNALLIACATAQNKVGAETIDAVAGELNLEEPSYSLTALTEEAKDFIAKLRQKYGLPVPRLEIPADLAVQMGGRRGDQTEDHGVIDESSNANGPKTKTWKQLSVAAIIVAILGGATLLFSRNESAVKLPDVTGQVREVIALVPVIYRVLMTHGPPTDTTINEGSIAKSPSSGEEPLVSSEISRRARPPATVRQNAPKTSHGNVAEPNLSGVDSTASGKRDQRVLGKPQGGDEQTRSSSRRSVQVVYQNSLVRDKPASDAEIVATLRRGTRVRLVGRKGDYWQISSIAPETIRGYVHKEDAFFEPLQ